MKKPPYTLDDLLYLMARLRDPVDGCPWDIKQSFGTIAPFTLEEVHEVIDCIERGDIPHLSEELGDLLFQVVFYAQLGKEQNQFEFADITHGVVDKLIRRHPHVFPDGTLESRRNKDSSPEESAIKSTWEKIKKQERNAKGKSGMLADIPLALPALSRAQKLQQRAAKAGFDWHDVTGVEDKIKEEQEELEDALSSGDTDAIADELGDILFSYVNLARHLKLDAETLLRQANRKFERRFEAMEQQIKLGGQNLEEMTPEQLDEHWKLAKAGE